MSLDQDLVQRAIFGLGGHVRYVAWGSGQEVRTTQKYGLAGGSDPGSDFYEELLVNPALLLLARQRGELDCGGLRHVIIGYGNFNQLVFPLPDGHLSVCVESDYDLIAALAEITHLITPDTATS